MKHLSKAPIREAVFDVKVVTDPKFDYVAFESAKDALRDKFPKSEIKKGVEVTFEINPDKVVPSKPREFSPGYFFTKHDNTEILQFRSDGFTFNRLPPYTSYDELIPQIREYWILYKSISAPKLISRVALRFINSIPLGKGKIHVEDYISVGPLIPEGLPEDISSYFSRLTIEYYEKGIAAHVVQRLSIEDDKTVVLYLDIDAYKKNTLEPNDTQLFESFNGLREFKNLVFFSFLTERTVKELE